MRYPDNTQCMWHCLQNGYVCIRLLQRFDGQKTRYMAMFDKTDGILTGDPELFMNVPVFDEEDLNGVLRLAREAKRRIDHAEGRIPHVFFREPRNWVDLVLRYIEERRQRREEARTIF